jgi:hypothetical protein
MNIRIYPYTSNRYGLYGLLQMHQKQYALLIIGIQFKICFFLSFWVIYVG